MPIDNVADLIAETIDQAGVKRVFGVVGDSLNGLTEALRKRKTIDWIHVRHEEVAAFAAAGRRNHRRACGMRGIVRARQPSSDQRSVRCTPKPHPGAGDRGPDPVRRNRRGLLPGDPSAGIIQGMQSLLRAGFRSGTTSLCAGKRHSRRGRKTRRRGAGRSRRRRTAAGAEARNFTHAGLLPAAPVIRPAEQN